MLFWCNFRKTIIESEAESTGQRTVGACMQVEHERLTSIIMTRTPGIHKTPTLSTSTLRPLQTNINDNIHNSHYISLTVCKKVSTEQRRRYSKDTSYRGTEGTSFFKVRDLELSAANLRYTTLARASFSQIESLSLGHLFFYSRLATTARHNTRPDRQPVL